MKKYMKILDLFSGVGGFGYGFEMSGGFRVIGAIEYDKEIANSMKMNHKHAEIFIGDIRKIKPEDVKKKIGKVDIIIGGPPCQGFSLKGQIGGMRDERNFLFKEYLKYVRFFKPKYVVMENVPSILTDQNGFFKKKIKNELEKNGYNVTCGILDASNFGVPQKRKRAFFLSSLKSEIKLPSTKTHLKNNVWDAISDLAYLESGEGSNESLYKLKAKSPYQRKMRKGSKKLFNHVATKHKEIAIDRLRRIPPEKGKEYLKEKISSTFGETWGRLEKRKPSPTIVTRFDTPSNGKNSHPFLNRAITPREAARLQSFPDTFVFYGNKTSITKQIGNAVPPLLGKVIAEEILKA